MHTYYIAKDNKTFGDEDTSGLEPVESICKRMFEGLTHPSNYDGVSRFIDPKGKVITRLTCQNFFSDDFRVVVIDL